METFLSKEIYSLVQYFGMETSDTTKYITDDLFINWDLVEAIFCDISDNCIIHEQPEDWFNDKKSSIHDIINEASYRLLNATDANVSQLWQRCCWTNRTKDIVTCYECLLENDQCRLLEALLVLTSVIERSLGDVYRIHNNNIPFLLRDLLETEYLYSILGKGVIRLMQMLLGTPRFLNIRNLAWHGFLSTNELKRNHVSILFILIASIGDMLRRRQISADEIPYRSEVQNFNEKINQIETNNTLVNILPSHEHLVHILHKSKFIGDSHVTYWKKICQYAQESRSSDCLVLFLPQFEHLLRRIFCKINGCPGRTMTAIAREKYTTLDDIFAPYIDKSNEQINRMYEFLGAAAVELYEDLFSHLAGPRVRDKISHGEKYLENIPFSLINILFNLTLYIVMKVNKYLQMPEDISCDIDMMDELNMTFVNYESIYHPSSILKHKLLNTYKQILNLSNIPKPKYEEIERNESIIAVKSFNITGQWLKNDEFCTFLTQMQIPTLLRPSEEQKIVRKLIQIVARMSDICQQISRDAAERFDAFTNKTLGSRQRDRYPEILRSILIVQDALTAISNTVLCFMNALFHSHTDRYVTDGKVLKFFITTNSYLDKVLRFSDVKCNKWEKVRNLTDIYNNKLVIFLPNYQ